MTTPVARHCVPHRLPAPTEALQVLSRRERELMTLVAAGHSDASIARQLFLAEKTVRNHLDSVCRKLAVRSRADAVVTWLGRPRWPPAAPRPDLRVSAGAVHSRSPGATRPGPAAPAGPRLRPSG